MSFKLNRYHRNNLFWIYPLIFAGLTFYAIIRDNLDRESNSIINTNVSIDSSLVRSAKSILQENKWPSKSIDSSLVYFVAE